MRGRNGPGTQARKRLRERRDLSLPHGIIFIIRHEHADAPYALALLGACRERPCRRAAEPSDEFAPSKANAHLAPPVARGQWIKQWTARQPVRRAGRPIEGRP
jgi:hypothetical protein